MKKIELPLNDEKIKNLKAGDIVYLSGEIITGRDAAHKKLIEMLQNKEKLPVDLKNNTIYYTGPCPKKPESVIGACGPTTSCRVDTYTPKLLDIGLKGMIGKGGRSKEVIDSMVKNKAVYFAAIGGAGALYSLCVKSAEVLCFFELMAEAIYKLTIKDFAVVVAIDCKGNSIYDK